MNVKVMIVRIFFNLKCKIRIHDKFLIARTDDFSRRGMPSHLTAKVNLCD